MRRHHAPAGLVLWVEVRRLALAQLQAHAKRHGIKLTATPAQLRQQAQAHITPELIAEARARVAEWFAGAEIKIKAPKRKA